MTDDVWESFATASWTDLADNLPGEAVRRQADQLHAQWRAKPAVSRWLSPRTTERSWRLDAEGEEQVARQLGALDSTWRSLHAVPIGRRDGDVDQIVIGPGGVFAVSAKCHPGKKVWVSGDILMVNGFRQPYVRDSRYKAARASQLLSSTVGFEVPVVGLVVLVGTAKETVKEQPRDEAVYVTIPRTARRWIQHQPIRLSADAVERIYAMARRSSTWSSVPAPAYRS